MTAITFMDFANNTVAGKDCATNFLHAEKILGYLTAHKGEQFAPKEIANVLNYSYQHVSRILGVLQKMNLVGAQAYKTTVHLKTPYCWWYTDKKVIDGITYTAKVYMENNEFDKEVTIHKWFAL